ncbi:MAG: hypothetical protein M9932_08625 [Xanthobacteraceae bacterium]|nr:hypothetical protein [Xanthobacteraceae bacterium]
MNERRAGDPDDNAPRSYCVFERDRELPRPTPWSPLTAEPSRPGRPIAKAGAAVVVLGAAALAWWFVG